MGIIFELERREEERRVENDSVFCLWKQVVGDIYYWKLGT